MQSNIEEIENYIYKRIQENKKKEFGVEMPDNCDRNIEAALKELDECNATWDLKDPHIARSHRRIAGPFIVLLKKTIRKIIMIYLRPLIEQQRIFNASVNRCLKELCNYTLNNALSSRSNLKDLQNSMADLACRIHEVKAVTDINEEKLNRLTGMKDSPDKDISPMGCKSAVFNGTESPFAGEGMALNIEEEEYKKEKYMTYLGHFDGVNKIVDLGCGKGELIELMAYNGKEVTGVDIDARNVDYCRKKGLNVIRQDACDFINQQNDNSIEGIIIINLLEYLPFDHVSGLLRVLSQKIKKKGQILIETINPACLYNFMSRGNYSVIQRALHPVFAQYLLKELEYNVIGINFCCPVPGKSRLEYTRIEEHPFNIIDDNLKKLNDSIFSYQSYYILAKKNTVV